MDLVEMLTEACAKADAAAQATRRQLGDTLPIGRGYVEIPLRYRKLVKTLIENRYTVGGGFKMESWSNYQWTPKVTHGLGQAAHIYFAAAEAAKDVLKANGFPDVSVRYYYD